MMNAMLNVEFQMLQKVAQQRPEKTEAGESKFRELMEERQNADQPTEAATQQTQTQEQTTAPVQEKYQHLIVDEGVTPIRRFGMPEDVANCVAAAASGLLDFSTGQVLNADGGFHIRRL